MPHTWLRYRRLLWAALLVVLALAHRPLLRAVVYPLAKPDAATGTPTHLLFLRSARVAAPSYTFARDFAQEDSRRVVLILRDYVRRAEAMGATPPFVETTRSMLVDAGVPPAQIQVLGDGNLLTAAERFTYMDNWLASQPDATHIVAVTHLFRTGYLRQVADEHFAGPRRSRVTLCGFARLGVHAGNWYRSATGLKQFFAESLRRVHLSLFGIRRPTITWDPDAYEVSLREGQR